MKEVLDVYNEEGKPLNKTVLRGCKDEDFLPGEHFAVSIIFIENSKGEFLIQKVPKGYYTSTGGHIHSGETPDEAIIRETKEEIGIDISHENYVSLGYRLLDFPLRFLYYLKKDIDIKDMALEESEVSSVQWMSVDEIYKLIDNYEMKRGHALLFKEIMKYRYNKESLNDVFIKYKDKYEVAFLKDRYHYFKLKFNSINNKYKLVITDSEIELYRKEHDINKKKWNLINRVKNIKNYSELCDNIDMYISEYERI